jgi:shikimate dehydrogenase
MIAATTRVFALLGDPVAHSLSPTLYNAAFRTLGLDAVYVALRCDTDRLSPLMQALALAGGGGNVTVPHKRVAARVAQRPAGGAWLTVNTFWGRDGRLMAADTDRVGITAAWRSLGGPAGTWLVIGTGGSALAAALAASQLGATVAVRSRHQERARAFRALLEDAGVSTSPEPSGRFIVNCTPLGLHPADELPLDPSEIDRETVALDLVYRPGSTRWVAALRRARIPALDGRVVLVEQAVAAFAHWFPDIDPPAEVMRAAVRAALGPPLD